MRAVRTAVAARNASSLVVAEHDGANISASTLACVTAANKIGGEVSLFIAGSNTSDIAANACKIAGVNKVVTCNNEVFSHIIAEDMAKTLLPIAKNYTHILAASSNTGKSYIPRLGALLDSAPLSDVIEVVGEDTFKRPTYAGNAISTCKMSDDVKLLLIRPTAFDKAETEGGSASQEDSGAADCSAGMTTFVSEAQAKSDRPDLTAAGVVISGGRGMKNGENFSMLYDLADKLGGAVGASRAAVDAGYVSNDLQIGQTGKVVAPALYMAVGISGAIQHLSGMKDSKVIVALNKDKEAPIFQVADFGLVDDLFKAVPELSSKV